MHVTNPSQLSQNQGLLQKWCTTWTTWTSCACWLLIHTRQSTKLLQQILQIQLLLSTTSAHQLWRLLNSVDALFSMLVIPHGQMVDCNLRTCFVFPYPKCNSMLAPAIKVSYAKSIHGMYTLNRHWWSKWWMWVKRKHCLNVKLIANDQTENKCIKRIARNKVKIKEKRNDQTLSIVSTCLMRDQDLTT